MSTVFARACGHIEMAPNVVIWSNNETMRVRAGGTGGRMSGFITMSFASWLPAKGALPAAACRVLSAVIVHLQKRSPNGLQCTTHYDYQELEAACLCKDRRRQEEHASGPPSPAEQQLHMMQVCTAANP